MHPIVIALTGLFVLTSSVVSPVPTEADQITPGSDRAVSTDSALSPTVKVAKASEGVRDLETAVPTYTVKLTAYNAVPGQTDADPFTTASGAYSNPEVVVARSQDLTAALPFGTIVAITRTAKDTPQCQFGSVEHLIGYRVVADSKHPRKVGEMDLLLRYDETVVLGGRTVSAARALGVCDQVTVRVVGHVDIKDIPATQAELVRLIEGTELARR